MAFIGHYDPIFDVPPAKRCAKARRSPPEVFRSREHLSLADLEFSDYGRDPRYPSGWYLLPTVLISLCVVLALVA